jgi:hypothetical protein
MTSSSCRLPQGPQCCAATHLNVSREPEVKALNEEIVNGLPKFRASETQVISTPSPNQFPGKREKYQYQAPGALKVTCRHPNGPK